MDRALLRQLDILIADGCATSGLVVSWFVFVGSGFGLEAVATAPLGLFHDSHYSDCSKPFYAPESESPV
jgi:hypothetical protein